MFPVRFPSMICQWNMSWGRDSDSHRPCRPHHSAWIWRTQAHGPSEKHSLSPTYHL